MPLTQDQATALQALANNVELAYQSVVKARTALSYLMSQGQATCNDIKTYNLVVKSTYFYQKSMSDMIRANGGQAPDVGAPLYVAYKGVPGDQAVNIDCSTGQLNGWRPTPLGDFFVPPGAVEWRREATPGDQASVRAVVERASRIPNSTSELRGPLGIGPLDIIALIIIGIVLYVAGSIVLKIVEALTDVPQKVEDTRQMAIVAAAHQANLEKRQKCFADCISRGGTNNECGATCSRLNPDTVPSPGSGSGTIGMIFAGVVLFGLVVIGWKIYKNRQAFASDGGSPRGIFPSPSRAHRARQLPAGKHDEDEDVIDAEYEEA